jgi:hypothetical protein
MSFSSLNELSGDTKKPTTLPSWVVAEQSLALRHPKRDYVAVFDRAMETASKGGNKNEVPVYLKDSSWEKLAAELNRDHLSYGISKP